MKFLNRIFFLRQKAFLIGESGSGKGNCSGCGAVNAGNRRCDFQDYYNGIGGIVAKDFLDRNWYPCSNRINSENEPSRKTCLKLAGSNEPERYDNP